MAIVSVNGIAAYDAQMFSPRFGAWQIDARIDDPAGSALSGKVQVALQPSGRTLSGTATLSGPFVDAVQVRVVAGAGGLGITAKPRHYEAPTLGLVLGDLLGDAGETLSSTADAGLLATQLPSWTTGARPVGSVIRDLFAVAAPAAAWRMLDDGTVWVGTDAFADSGIDATTYEVVDRSAEENSIRVEVDGPLQLVGTTFEGGKVNCVQDEVPHVGRVASRAWFERPIPRGSDRLLAALQDLVRGTAPGIDHRFLYWATVAAQSGPTVDGDPQNAGVPDMGQVTLAAQAGDSVDGVTGGRVLVGWAGDPSQRFAMGFDGDAIPTTRVLTVLSQLLLGDKTAVPALVGELHQIAESVLVKALIAAFTALATASVGPLAPLQAQFTACATALTAYQTAAAAANNFLSTKVGISP
jgi:hypothetical protein